MILEETDVQLVLSPKLLGRSQLVHEKGAEDNF